METPLEMHTAFGSRLTSGLLQPNPLASEVGPEENRPREKARVAECGETKSI